MPLFTTAEARAWKAGYYFADITKYPDAAITAAELTIRAEFENRCDVSFVPVASTVVLDGNGLDTIYLPYHNPFSERPPRAVTTVTVEIDGVATTDFVAYPSKIVLTEGLFTQGLQNIEIVFTHGWATVPLDIKEAALARAVQILVPTDRPLGAVNYSDGSINWSYQRSEDRGRPYGDPAIDEPLKRYNETLPGIG